LTLRLSVKRSIMGFALPEHSLVAGHLTTVRTGRASMQKLKKASMIPLPEPLKLLFFQTIEN
jgi:hypothetical protein